MVNVNSGDTLELDDGDTLEIGDYKIYYNSQEDRWEVKNSASKRSDGRVYGPDFVQGKVGNNALDFDGRNDYVSIEDVDRKFDGSMDFTLALWFKTNNNSDQTFLSLSDDDSTNYRINENSSGNWALSFEANGINSNASSQVTDGSWHHGVVTYSGDSFTFYVDGSSDGTETNSSWPAQATEIKIGRRFVTSSKDPLNGKIDDVRVYDRTLSSSEVTALYNYGNDGSSMPPTDGLVAHYDFEQPEDPSTAVDTSTITHVPKNSSGSLFPTDLGDVLQGKALADNGNIYDSVQTAVDNASGYVFIGPGKFDEQVIIEQDGVTLVGSGYDTHIQTDSDSNTIDVDADNVLIRGLSVTGGTPGDGGNNDGFWMRSGAGSVTFQNVWVRDSENEGFALRNGQEHIVSNCVIEDSTNDGIRAQSPRCIVEECIVKTTDSGHGITIDDDGVVSNCVILDSGDWGVHGISDDGVLIGNRVHNASSNGVGITGAGDRSDNIVANNRASDSGDNDIYDGGSGTVLDDNLGGSAN